MTEIEELILQAEAVKKRWRKPKADDVKPPRARSWQEILENRKAPPGM